MKIFLKEVFPKITKFSKRIDYSTILCDYPWVIWENEFSANHKKIIFKKDNEILYSDKGNVTKGRWEYLPNADSLYIEYGNIKKLCNQAFIDNYILLLKVDTEEEIIALVNEKKIDNIKNFRINKYIDKTYDKLLPEIPNQEASEERKVPQPVRILTKNEEWKLQKKEYIIKLGQSRVLLISFGILFVLFLPAYIFTLQLPLLFLSSALLLLDFFLLIMIRKYKIKIHRINRTLEDLSKSKSNHSIS